MWNLKRGNQDASIWGLEIRDDSGRTERIQDYETLETNKGAIVWLSEDSVGAWDSEVFDT